jgi:endonuclease I
LAVQIIGIDMKQFIFLTLLTTTLWAQIPDGYYDNATGLSGAVLQQTLNDIIDGHTEYPYTSSGTDTWDILKVSDRDPNNSNNVICIYTQYSIDADQEYNSGSGWSREHVWAKSHGDFGTATGAGTDLHNLKPEDVSVNSAKGNKDFDDGGTLVTDNSPPSGYDGILDCYTSSTTWEPPDVVKGDVARIIFYMVTRYEGENGEVDLEMVDYADSAPNGEPFHGVQSTLYSWHVADPVDDFERNRNDIIHDYQNNRNPYIDHPEYADLIWGDPQELPDPPSNLSADNISETSLTLSWLDNSDNELGFYIYQDNERVATLGANLIEYVVDQLQAATTYGFEVSAFNAEGESSRATFTVSTTGGGGSTVTHFVEDFETWSGSGSSYFDGDILLSSGMWNVYKAGNYSLGDPPYSGDYTIAINDDTQGAHITTPAVNTLGTISFYYYQRNGTATDEFQLQKSDNGAAFELVSTHSYNVGSTYTLFSAVLNDTSSSVRIRLMNDNQTGHLIIDDFTVTQYDPVSINGLAQVIPAKMILSPAYPNPFNAGTMITFHIFTSSHATLDVFDIRGKLVTTLVNADYSPGSHQIQWKGTRANGTELPSGIYLVRLVTPTATQVQRLSILR